MSININNQNENPASISASVKFTRQSLSKFLIRMKYWKIASGARDSIVWLHKYGGKTEVLADHTKPRTIRCGIGHDLSTQVITTKSWQLKNCNRVSTQIPAKCRYELRANKCFICAVNYNPGRTEGERQDHLPRGSDLHSGLSDVADGMS